MLTATDMHLVEAMAKQLDMNSVPEALFHNLVDDMLWHGMWLPFKQSKLTVSPSYKTLKTLPPTLIPSHSCSRSIRRQPRRCLEKGEKGWILTWIMTVLLQLNRIPVSYSRGLSLVSTALANRCPFPLSAHLPANKLFSSSYSAAINIYYAITLPHCKG